MENIKALPYYSFRSKEYKNIKNRIRYNIYNYSKQKVKWSSYNNENKPYRRNYYFKNKKIISTKKSIQWSKAYYKNLQENRLKSQEYQKKNKIKLTKYRKDLRLSNKRDVIFHYTNGKMACQNCGIDIFELLTIDHVFSNGNKHRRTISNTNLSAWLIRNNFPKGYQIFCYNCNLVKERVSLERFIEITNKLKYIINNKKEVT